MDRADQPALDRWSASILRPGFAGTRLHFDSEKAAFYLSLRLKGRPRPLSIPWDFIEREAEDCGAYLLLMKRNANRSICVGRFGELRFERGWYVSVGSAMQNLTSRIARHRRHRKRLYWPVDYLRGAASECRALPIRSSPRQECASAEAMGSILKPGPAGFGSSDRGCPPHLLQSPEFPLHLRKFHKTLEPFRMPKVVWVARGIVVAWNRFSPAAELEVGASHRSPAGKPKTMKMHACIFERDSLRKSLLTATYGLTTCVSPIVRARWIVARRRLRLSGLAPRPCQRTLPSRSRRTCVGCEPMPKDFSVSRAFGTIS